MSDPMIENYPEEQLEFECLVRRYIKTQGVKPNRAVFGRLMMMLRKSTNEITISLLLSPEEKKWNSPTFETIWRGGPVSDDHRWRDHLDELRRALILERLADV